MPGVPGYLEGTEMAGMAYQQALLYTQDITHNSPPTLAQSLEHDHLSMDVQMLPAEPSVETWLTPARPQISLEPSALHSGTRWV